MNDRRDRDVDRFGRWAASDNESVLQRIVCAPPGCPSCGTCPCGASAARSKRW